MQHQLSHPETGNGMKNRFVTTLLQQRRNELRARSENLAAELHCEPIPEQGGFVDHASAHSNDTVLEAIRQSAQVEIEQIDAALRRIEDGSYERCNVCGGPIGFERLEALRYATTCIGCAA